MCDFAVDVTQQFECRRMQLLDELTDRRSQLAALRDLMRRARGAGCAFDDDDFRHIQTEIDAGAAAILQIESEIEEREATRRKKMLILKEYEQALLTRATTIDEADAESGVLDNKHLKAYFADKQKIFTDLMIATKRELAVV